MARERLARRLARRLNDQQSLARAPINDFLSNVHARRVHALVMQPAVLRDPRPMDRYALRLPIPVVEILGAGHWGLTPRMGTVVCGPGNLLRRLVGRAADRTRPGFVRFLPASTPMVVRPTLVPNDLMRLLVQVLPQAAVLACSVLTSIVGFARSVETSAPATGARLRVPTCFQRGIFSLPVSERIGELETA